MPLTLPQSCATCRYLDEDQEHCGAPQSFVLLIGGYIPHPERIVCDLHAPLTPEADDVAAPV